MEREYFEPMRGENLFSQNTQETVGEIIAGDALRLRREDTGVVTKMLPVLNSENGSIMFGRGSGKLAFRYWLGEIEDDGKIHANGITYEIVEKSQGNATRESEVSRVWLNCLKSATSDFLAPAHPALEADETRLIAEMIIKSQDILDTREKLTKALLTLFGDNTEQAIVALSATVNRLFTARGDKIDGKLDDLPIY
ncbi:MAG: hypothetical protein WCP14_01330 [bacterium]